MIEDKVWLIMSYTHDSDACVGIFRSWDGVVAHLGSEGWRDTRGGVKIQRLQGITRSACWTEVKP